MVSVKLEVGDKVKTRGDMGSFKMIVTQIHNGHYCECRQLILGIPFGKERHFCIEYLIYIGS
jgi:hypothetical protein